MTSPTTAPSAISSPTCGLTWVAPEAGCTTLADVGWINLSWISFCCCLTNPASWDRRAAALLPAAFAATIRRLISAIWRSTPLMPLLMFATPAAALPRWNARA